MANNHLDQITAYYKGRIPFDNHGTKVDSEDGVRIIMEVSLSEAALQQIPNDEVCVAHMSGFHKGPGRSAQIFVTDKAINVVHTGVFKKEKILGGERIRPESISGVERQKDFGEDLGSGGRLR